mgnify:CR=1 FL=1
MKQQIKMIGLDLDGTLLNDKKEQKHVLTNHLYFRKIYLVIYAKWMLNFLKNQGECREIMINIKN